MCGHLGWYITSPVRQLPPMAGVLEVLMDDRGEDSWGFYAYPFKDGKTQYDNPILKRGLGTLTENVPARSLRKFSMFMGHSRDASVGKVTIANSHPFEIGDIVGAHNGAIYDWEKLNKKYGRHFEVDSQHIFAHIDEDASLADIHGYGSIVFIRKSEPTKVNLYRWNDASVMAYADVYHKNGDKLGVVWASTKQAIESAIYVSGLEFKAFDLEMNKKAYIIEPDPKNGVPTMYHLKDQPYDFGTKHSFGSYSGGVYLYDFTTHVYCLECRVMDSAGFHHGKISEGATHNPSGAQSNIHLLEDQTKKLNEDSKVTVTAMKRFHEDNSHLEGTYMGKAYKIAFDEDHPVVTVDLVRPPFVRGATTYMTGSTHVPVVVVPTTGQTDSPVECALCGGPGPFKSVGRFRLCDGVIAPISCWQSWKTMPAYDRAELMTEFLNDFKVKERAKQIKKDMEKPMGFDDPLWGLMG